MGYLTPEQLFVMAKNAAFTISINTNIAGLKVERWDADPLTGSTARRGKDHFLISNLYSADALAGPSPQITVDDMALTIKRQILSDMQDEPGTLISLPLHPLNDAHVMSAVFSDAEISVRLSVFNGLPADFAGQPEVPEGQLLLRLDMLGSIRPSVATKPVV